MKRLIKLFNKYQEVLLYLLFGGLTFFISIVSFSILYYGFEINELIANLWSWIFSVLFAYITNRMWVFKTRTSNDKGLLLQFCIFVLGRVVTLLLEEFILLIFMMQLDFPGIIVKIVAQIVVIISNYFISKFWVF